MGQQNKTEKKTGRHCKYYLFKFTTNGNNENNCKKRNHGDGIHRFTIHLYVMMSLALALFKKNLIQS